MTTKNRPCLDGESGGSDVAKDGGGGFHLAALLDSDVSLHMTGDNDAARVDRAFDKGLLADGERSRGEHVPLHSAFQQQFL